MSLDASGDVYVTGYFGYTAESAAPFALGGGSLPTAGLTDLFVARYAADGSHRASRAFGTPCQDKGAGIAVDASGALLVSGTFGAPRDMEPGDTVNFGSGPITATSIHDAFVTRLTL